MNRTRSIVMAVAVTGGLALMTQPVLAAQGGRGDKGTVIGGPGGPGSPDTSGGAFFGGALSGANEVREPGGPTVGDPDGSATAFMHIKGDQVSYAFQFSGIGTPTKGHLHAGAKGVNGAVKIPFFAEPLAQGQTTASGKVTVKDEQLLEDLRTNPGNYYFNLHTEEYPGGAVRGQVERVTGAPKSSETVPQGYQGPVIQGVRPSRTCATTAQLMAPCAWYLVPGSVTVFG